MPLTIANFTLPTLAEVPKAVKDQFVAGSFPTDVRNFHLERLPRLVIPSGTYIVCPWCGKQKDSRSMQIDHIIPIRIYTRYRLYLYLDKVGGDDHDSDLKRVRFLKDAYNDHNNLLLACSKCNSVERDGMPTAEGLKGAAERVKGSDCETRLKTLCLTLSSIDNLPRRKYTGVNVHDWVLSGATWPTTRMKTRHASPSPYGGRAKELLDQLSLVENAVINYLVKGRPAWTFLPSELQATQTTVKFTDEEGRLCFYCLGLFKKQAFHIDHINPSSRRADNPATYNQPSNLIPVCRTCNTSKGDRSLSKLFLAEMLKSRQDQDLPGVEHVANPVFPVNFTSYLEYVADRRNTLLGL